MSKLKEWSGKYQPKWTLEDKVQADQRVTTHNKFKPDTCKLLTGTTVEKLGYGGPVDYSPTNSRFKLDQHMMEVKKHQQATRHNAGKVELVYLFDCPLANEAKCKAAMFGAAKYNRNNWRKGLPVSNFVNSALRHLQSFMNGETLDPESGINHLGHVLWNVEKALEFSLTKPELDDRFKPEPIKTEVFKHEVV